MHLNNLANVLPTLYQQAIDIAALEESIRNTEIKTDSLSTPGKSNQDEEKQNEQDEQNLILDTFQRIDFSPGSSSSARK